MRLLRLRLTNYRGIETCEASFRREGITVVTGPNEVGKTSLAEAVRLLFDHMDSAASRVIRSIKPVHRDSGPEIELEAESGPYSFTYSKRFLKRPQTTLVVSKPRPESLTGREAHERALAILAETIDVDLWRSLLVSQGKGIDQAVLSKEEALTKALDRAAGGTATDPRGESLFKRVGDEVGRYFTEKGTERKDIQGAREDLETAEGEAEKCRGELATLDRDIGAASRLAESIRGLELRVAELREKDKANQGALAELERLTTSVNTARLRHESAEKSLKAAERDVADRAGLVRQAAEARTALDLAAAASGTLGPELGTAEKAVSGAESELREADSRRKEAEGLAEVRRLDEAHLRGLLDLETLRERKDRVDKARTAAAAGRDILANNLVDDRRLEAIEEAEKGVNAAAARLEAGAPTIRLKALANVKVETGGKRRSLKEGAEATISVPDRAKIVVPEALELEVVAGSNLTSLQRKLEEARTALEEACRSADVGGLDDARRSHSQRKEGAQAVAKLKEVEKADLRDLTYEQLETKVVGLAKHLPEYSEQRPANAPGMPKDLDQAKRGAADARRDAGVARTAAEDARGELDRARDKRDRLRRDSGDKEAIRRGAEGDWQRATSALEEARKQHPDDDLAGVSTKAEEAVAAAATDLTAAQQVLTAKGPERIRALAETDAESLKGAERQLVDSRRDAGEVRRRLDSLGEAGLHERHELATSRGEAARSQLGDILRSAAGARLLFETLKTHREAVRAAYLGPLRKSVETLGRILHDETFSVEVDEDLKIVSRTLKGVTVPFEDLSTGAREQLSLLARIACAMLVAEKGGPLLLDDVLGHTDHQRLAAMGAILRIGGERCQIVLLTSMPERYAHVGDAQVVDLSS